MLRLTKMCRYCKKQSEICKKCTGCEKVWYCSKDCQKSDWSKHKTSCSKTENTETVSGSKCHFCGSARSDLKRCKGCLVVSYCCKQCQVIDWPDHKIKCKSVQQTKTHETTDKQTDKVKPKNNEDHVDDDGNSCAACGKSGCSQRCSRCKSTHYCSRECQAGDWKTHKTDCKKLTKENSEPQASAQVKEDWEYVDTLRGNQYIRLEPGLGLFQTNWRPPEMEKIDARRPPGSLEKAKAIARRRFLFLPVVDDLDEVPFEHPFPFMRETQRLSREFVLVAFMFKYHPYAARHAIYIQDQKDEVTKVEFYLDFDNPFPFFSYNQVKPGNFLCLINPLMHGFMDGTVGIRIDDPSDVTIIDGKSVA